MLNHAGESHEAFVCRSHPVPCHQPARISTGRRYELNNQYRELLTDAGLVISGTSPDGRLAETIELADHPFYIGVQFHPEFTSRPNRPHPLFQGFISAAFHENTKQEE